MAYTPTIGLVNRVSVGTNGDYATLKEAVDWFNASATCDMEIYLDACHHLIADTITVNNSSYSLTIAGLGSNVTNLDAATGLTNKPMFNIKSTFDIKRVIANGSTLTDYGDLSTEVFALYDTTAGLYSEIKDIFMNTFYTVIKDTIGSDLFIFDYYMYDCIHSGIEINHTGSGNLDTEIGTIENTPTGIDFVKASTVQSVLISSLYFTNPTSGIGIKYDGANVVPNDRFAIQGCFWNYVGDFVSGFDFTRQDGRDAGITIKSCVGLTDRTPYFKINLEEGTAATTCTTQGVWYRAAGFRQLMHLHTDAAATGGSFTLTIGSETTGAISWNATPATLATNIKTAVEALTNVTTVTVATEVNNEQWTIRFDTGGEGFEYPFSADVSSLTSVTSMTVIPSFYVCKAKLGDTTAGTSNRITNLAKYPYTGIMYISGNLSVNANGENNYIGVRANGTGEIIAPFYVRTSTTGVPKPFNFTVFVEELNENDYFEIMVMNNVTGGREITISDITIYGSSR